MYIKHLRNFLWPAIFLTLFSYLPALVAAQSLVYTQDNSTTGATPKWHPPASISKLGILVRPIRSMSIINASVGARPHIRNPRLDQISGRGNKWTVLSGTFYYWPKYKGRGVPFPKGMIIRNNVVEAPENCSPNSGALVLRGGQVVIARSYSKTVREAELRFGNNIDGLMTCGVLLIEDGAPRDSNHLIRQQDFSFGLDTVACRPTNHSLVGIRNGVAYAIFNPGGTRTWVSCRKYRDLFAAEGFGALIKFDGSTGFYYKDSAMSDGQGFYNPTGFFIEEW